MNGPQATGLPTDGRLHLNHGPIDLIIEAFGEPDECAPPMSRRWRASRRS